MRTRTARQKMNWRRLFAARRFATVWRRNRFDCLPGAYLGQNWLLSKFEMCLILLAHPTRFERVTFAFGGQRYANSWRKVEEARSRRRIFPRKPLKGLALPRGIEPLFQP